MADLCIEYEVKEHLDLGQLAEDSEQLPALEMDLTGVARLQHLSFLRETQGNSEDVLNSELVEVGSTLDNLVQVAGAVAVGQPVLLVGEAGVGKTSLVRELARRTGKELLTLQVGHDCQAYIIPHPFRSAITQTLVSWLVSTDVQSCLDSLSGNLVFSRELSREERGFLSRMPNVLSMMCLHS